MNPLSKSPAVKQMFVLTLLLVLVLLVRHPLQAQTLDEIYTFTGGGDGGTPLAGLITDGAGNFFGTASIGGNSNCSNGCGVVFKIDSSGNEAIIHSFIGGADGSNPQSSLLMDGAGNLYGATYNGGGSVGCLNGCGTVFEIPAAGGEKVLYSFSGASDGANPIAGLTMDRAGNLYGTTFNGGSHGFGTVFKLTQKGHETLLYSFTGGSDGANPVAGVTFDAKGSLYGTTSLGGDSQCANPFGTTGCGTVFRLVPIALTPKGNATIWKETILHTFESEDDGGTPYAGLISDKAGNLYGATTTSGIGGGGTVFELTPSMSGWSFNLLYGLPGWSFSGSFRNLALDSSGNLFATTHCDGVGQNGTIYELIPAGGAWNYTQLWLFDGSDGSFLFSNLTFDNQGNLYGTTSSGGEYYYGVVFKLIP